MTARRTATQRRILQEAYVLFFRDGFARVGVDAIAEAAGVTKRTLYNHFPSKDHLVEAVLTAQDLEARKRFESWAARDASDAPAFLDSLFDGLAEWSSGDGWTGSGFSKIAVELSSLPGHPARLAARRHKESLETWLAGRLRELGVAGAEEISVSVLILIEGAMMMALLHQDRLRYIDAAKQVAIGYLEADSPSPAQARRLSRSPPSRDDYLPDKQQKPVMPAKVGTSRDVRARRRRPAPSIEIPAFVPTSRG